MHTPSPDSVPPVCRPCAASVPPVCRQCAASVPPVCRQCAASVPPVCRPCAARVPPVCRPCAARVPPVCRQTCRNPPCFVVVCVFSFVLCPSGVFRVRTTGGSRGSPGGGGGGRPHTPTSRRIHAGGGRPHTRVCGRPPWPEAILVDRQIFSPGVRRDTLELAKGRKQTKSSRRRQGHIHEGACASRHGAVMFVRHCSNMYGVIFWAQDFSPCFPGPRRIACPKTKATLASSSVCLTFQAAACRLPACNSPAAVTLRLPCVDFRGIKFETTQNE